MLNYNWQVHGKQSPYLIQDVKGKYSTWIVDGVMSKKNAHLIASAPDMYEALKLSRLHCAGGAKVISIIDRALDKAKGKLDEQK
jgi:hypothetical protein